MLPMLRHVPEVSVEEFVDGEEFTYDTICADGRILFENICWYRPRPLQMRMHEWISPVSISLRDLDASRTWPAAGRWARAVLRRAGLPRRVHPHGVVPQGRRRGGVRRDRRPPARRARSVDLMNYATDGDLYAGWAEAVVHGGYRSRSSAGTTPAAIFKRARGRGPDHRTRRASTRCWAEYGEHVALLDLLPVGAPRRDWRSTVIGDGMVIVRHPELQPVIEMTERVRPRLPDVRVLRLSRARRGTAAASAARSPSRAATPGPRCRPGSARPCCRGRRRRPTTSPRPPRLPDRRR